MADHNPDGWNTHSKPPQDDPIQTVVDRMKEDRELEEEIHNTRRSVSALIEKRRDLKHQIRGLNHEIGEGDKHRAFLRTLPEHFWLPIHWTYGLLSELVPVRNSRGKPTLTRWSEDADVGTFCVNVVLGIFALFVIARLAAFIL